MNFLVEQLRLKNVWTFVVQRNFKTLTNYLLRNDFLVEISQQVMGPKNISISMY